MECISKQPINKQPPDCGIEGDLAGGCNGAVDIFGLSLCHRHEGLASARIICLERLPAARILKFAIDQQLPWGTRPFANQQHFHGDSAGMKDNDGELKASFLPAGALCVGTPQRAREGMSRRGLCAPAA